MRYEIEDYYSSTKIQRRKLINIALNLFVRDIKTRYSGSILGFGWMVLNPLFFVLIISLVFSLVFKSNDFNVPYYMFVLVGYIHWLFFSQTISLITTSLMAHRDIIVNVYFPRLAIPLSVLLSKTLDFFILMTITFTLLFFVSGMSVINQIPVYLWLVFIQIFIQFGIGLIVSITNVYFRDIQHLINIGLQLLFYVTPVVYDISVVPIKFHEFIRLNPIAVLLIEYRNLLFTGNYQIKVIVSLSIVGVLILIAGLVVFQKNQKKIAEFI